MNQNSMSSIDQRTQLAGSNRLELLLFKLQDGQTYGINVFKIREILKKTEMNRLPNSNENIEGVITVRNQTIPVINLDKSIKTRTKTNDPEKNQFIIIAEYNRQTQGLLVESVENIINTNWEEITPPPKTVGQNHYLTAITKYEDKLVQILDVEKILYEIAPQNDDPEDNAFDFSETAKEKFIYIVDDSTVARKQVEKCMKNLALPFKSFQNGQELYDEVVRLKDNNKLDEVLSIISDIEMPKMDGYTLSSKLKSDSSLSMIPVILHTSLSGMLNENMVKKVKADFFLSKFSPDELIEITAKAIEKRLES